MRSYVPFFAPDPQPARPGVWWSVLADLAASSGAPGLRAWFDGAVPVGLDEDTLILSVPNSLAEEYIGSRFKGPIEEILKGRVSPSATLVLTSPPPRSDARSK